MNLVTISGTSQEVAEKLLDLRDSGAEVHAVDITESADGTRTAYVTVS